MKNRLFTYLLISHLCATYGNSQTHPSLHTGVPIDTISVFTLPKVPATLNTPEVRADYVVNHYWENINFADTNYVHHPEVTEQAWVDYIDILQLITHEKAGMALKNLFRQAEASKVCYSYLMQLADKYLYEPLSPMYNEKLYLSVLEAAIASPLLTETEKARHRFRRQLALQNNVGTQANDFVYTLDSGKQCSLYALTAPYILVFFNNPGCQACTATIAELNNTTVITNAVSQKKLQILSIYSDEDLNEWKKELSRFPTSWINGYDSEQIIKEKNLYDLKALPTLYLLDKKKNVLLKDTSVAEIEQLLAAPTTNL